MSIYKTYFKILGKFEYYNIFIGKMIFNLYILLLHNKTIIEQMMRDIELEKENNHFI